MGIKLMMKVIMENDISMVTNLVFPYFPWSVLPFHPQFLSPSQLKAKTKRDR